jgi:excinuclease UvrABC ATPase subunit
VSLSVEDAVDFFSNIKFNKRELTIAVQVIKEIKARLNFLNEVGSRLPNACQKCQYA